MNQYQGKKTFKRLFKYLWAEIGATTSLSDFYLRARHRYSNSQSVVILLYHRVIPSDKLSEVFSSPAIVVFQDTFEKQIRFLLQNYKVMSLYEFFDLYLQNSPFPQKTAVLTFDDGWSDNYVYAFPILKKYNIPATIFLTTGFMGNTSTFWQEKLMFLLSVFQNRPEASISDFCICLRKLPDKIKDSLKLNMNKKVLWNFPEELKYMNDKTLNDLMDCLEKLLNYPKIPINTNNFITWDQAREMISSKIDFGSHSQNHKILPQLSSEDIEREVSTSKKKIEDELQTVVKAFAYPNGAYDEIVIDKLRKTSYQIAVTTEPGLNSFRTNHYRLKRININEYRFMGPNGKFSEKLFAARLTSWL